MDRPWTFCISRRVAAFVTLMGLLGACHAEPLAPASRDAARGQSGVHLSTSFTNSFVNHQIHIVSAIPGPTGDPECLGPENGLARSGQRVIHSRCVYPYNPSDYNYDPSRQLFYVEAAPWMPWRVNGALVVIKSAFNTSLCLDIRNGTAFGSEPLQLYSCHYGSSQVFELPPRNAVGITRGLILTEVSGFQMAFDAFIPFSTGWVQQYVRHQGQNQRWEIQIHR